MEMMDSLAMRREYYSVIKQFRRETRRYKSVVLTKEEIESIKSKWDIVKCGYCIDSFKVFKYYCGFNPRFIPDELFQPLFSSTLNPYVYRSFMSDKGNYDNLLKGINQPETIMRVFDSNIYYLGKHVEKSKIVDDYKSIGKCFVKPAINSCQGFGCKMVDTRINSLDLLLDDYRDFVLQLPLSQSDKTAVFNPDSLNCFRVTSLNVNGVVTAPTVCFKFGNKGSIVDNIGSGGYIVGVDPTTGRLNERAYNSNLNTITSVNDIQLKDVEFPEVASLIRFAIDNHINCFPKIGIIGWDLALDEDNQPVMIEANTGDATNYVGIHLEQIATATPIFGERTEEVIEYVCSHTPRFLI